MINSAVTALWPFCYSAVVIFASIRQRCNIFYVAVDSVANRCKSYVTAIILTTDECATQGSHNPEIWPMSVGEKSVNVSKIGNYGGHSEWNKCIFVYPVSSPTKVFIKKLELFGRNDICQNALQFGVFEKVPRIRFPSVSSVMEPEFHPHVSVDTCIHYYKINIVTFYFFFC